MNVKDNPGSKRYTILMDNQLYLAAKARARMKRLKMYQYLNELIAHDTGRTVPVYLKHTPANS